MEEAGERTFTLHNTPGIFCTTKTSGGLAAAPLGKRANVSDFYFHVLAPLQRDFYRKNAEIERRLETYQKERKAFLEQLETVKKMQQELQKLCDLAGRRRKTREENRLLQEKKQQRKEEYLAGRTRLGEEKKNLGQTLGRQEEQWKAALKNQEEFLRQVEEKQTQAEAAAAKKRDFLEKETQVRASIKVLDRFFKKSACAAKHQLAEEYHREAKNASEEAERLREEQKKLEDRSRCVPKRMRRTSP